MALTDDLAALMRLAGAIRSSLASVDPSQAAVATTAMTMSYSRCRAEVRSAIGEDLHGEFDRLMPEMEERSMARSYEAARVFNEARSNLGRLEGWLGGQIEYLQFMQTTALEAEALARSQAGIGFKAPSESQEE